MRFIARGIEKLVDAIAQLEDPGSNCSLNLAIGNTGVITCKNGSLVSVIEILGCRNYVGYDEHEKNAKELTTRLQPFFKSKHHDIDFIFETDNDKDLVSQALDETYSPVSSSIKALNLSYQSILEEEKALLGRVSSLERCWLVCWTNKKLVGNISEHDREPAQLVHKMHSTGNQTISGFNHLIMRGSAHDAMVSSLLSTFDYLRYRVEKLTSTEIIKNIRQLIEPNKVSNRWQPIVIGNGTRSRLRIPDDVTKKSEIGAGGLMPPKIGSQVWPCEPEKSNANSDVQIIGNRAYKVMVLKIQPNGKVAFNKLLQQATKLGVPLRFSGVLKSSGASMLTAKMMIASITTIVPIPSRALMLRNEVTNLERYAKENRESLTAIQMSFVTWTKADDLKKLQYNSDKLLQIISGWEQASAYFLKDDIFEGFCGTLPAYSAGNSAPAAVAPLNDILFNMPITRPVMPSNKGGMCFLSEDGKHMPWQPFDYNIIKHHIYLVVGEPGYGKSAFINNMQVCLLSSSNSIPYIGIADVGTSSLGAIQLAQSILPEGKKHFAKYHRLKNVENQSYNFLEQDYGLRVPLKEHFDEISNHLELMMSDDRTHALHEQLPGLIKAVIRLAYRIRSDRDSKASPEMFKRAAMNDSHWPIVAKALYALNFEPAKDVSWWEIFDLLHENNYFHEATLVMRFVAPTLPFLAQVAMRPEIREEYTGEYDSGTSIVDYFSRKIGELVEAYPIFSSYTQLDLGDSKIIALDLEEVVPRASEGDFALKKQGAIFMATAARILTSRFFWKEDRLMEIPEKYHSFHSPRIKAIRQTTNVLQIDELQRFSGISQTDNLVIKIANEGRKWEIGVVLASQDTMEMPDRLIQFSTVRIICGFEEQSIDNVQESFKLNPTEVHLVINKIRPPTKNGGWILMQMDTDNGKYSHLLNIKMGPQKLWGLSTRSKDAFVRSEIYKAFDDVRGRKILSKLYPSGSIGEEYDYKVQSLSETHDVGLMKIKDIEENRDVMQSIINSIITRGKELEIKGLED